MTNYRVDSSFPDSTRVDIPLDDCKVEQYYTLEDILGGDEAGTTDTDRETHTGYNESNTRYTTIYRKY